MAYRDAGEGTPIVLVHGSTNDYRIWNAQFSVFSASYRVVTVSLRHFYPELWDGTGTDFSIEQHAQDVAALIKKLNLGKVHLVGHSRGGAVAIEVAKSHAEVIRTLVLPDGNIEMPVPETAEAKEAGDFTKTLIGTLQENLKAGDPAKAAEIFVDMLSGPGTWLRFPEPTKEMFLANIYSALGDKGRPISTCADVKKFDFPVLLMTADKSPKKFEFFYNEMRKCREFPATVVIPKRDTVCSDRMRTSSARSHWSSCPNIDFALTGCPRSSNGSFGSKTEATVPKSDFGSTPEIGHRRPSR
jgi:pimeloyl-ACP methyl ester carboxylesterase